MKSEKYTATQNPEDSIYEMLENDFQCKNTDYGVLVTIETVNGKEDVLLKNEKFHGVLANRYRKEYGEIVKPSTIKSCILSYYGQVLEEYAKVKNSNRCDRGDGGSILIDSGDFEDTYFIISEKGIQSEENGSAYFYKHSRKGEIPYPDIKNGDINRIFKYCRVPQNMQRIFIAYLVSLFIGDIEHPCLVLNGSQGSGKTTMSTFIKALVDPIADNKPSLFPKNDADLALMFRDNYLVAFDNLQTLNARLSDKLCTIVTGVTESRRKLYTDDEMVHFDLCQPIILNGIHDIVKREDMLSRCIVMNLEKPVGKDRGASEKVALMEEFMDDRAIILGGIFNILREVLYFYQPNYASRAGYDVRMSSFYDYGYWICEIWEEEAGTEFCADYISLLKHQLKDFKKNTDLIELMKGFLEGDDLQWEGTMSELLTGLKNTKELLIEIFADTKLPATPNRLSREINNLKVELEAAGIIVEMSKTKNNSRYIILTLEENEE